MTNNDVLRRIRYIFDYSDKKMMALFAQADQSVTREQLSNWLKKDDDADYKDLPDKNLAAFLNGFIAEKRGKRDGVEVKNETQLNHNIIFRKLKIALQLESDDILHILDLAEFRLGKHELSAFFRKPGHKHYRPCKDQVLRNFLDGMKLCYRDKHVADEPINPWTAAGKKSDA